MAVSATSATMQMPCIRTVGFLVSSCLLGTIVVPTSYLKSNPQSVAYYETYSEEYHKPNSTRLLLFVCAKSGI